MPLLSGTTDLQVYFQKLRFLMGSLARNRQKRRHSEKNRQQQEEGGKIDRNCYYCRIASVLGGTHHCDDPFDEFRAASWSFPVHTTCCRPHFSNIQIKQSGDL
jgi:hypothetical protein